MPAPAGPEHYSREGHPMDIRDEAAQLRQDAVDQRDYAHAIIGEWGDPRNGPMALAQTHATLSLAIEQRRTADAMERIADRLDSWTADPGPLPEWSDPKSMEAHTRGPELRVRRW